MKPWEDLISINNFIDFAFEVLPQAGDFFNQGSGAAEWHKQIAPYVPDNLLYAALSRDTFPLPVTGDREGYWGDNHLGYWASGLRDYRILLDCCERLGLSPSSYLDIGCASGRVIRHFAANSPDINVHGCDINRRHVEWVSRFLSPSILAFQNHSIPTLPLPDASLDLVSAFSVFTHIEAFETSWLMELRRILKPGGIAWLTIHSELTWEEMDRGWPLYRNLLRYNNFTPDAPRPPMSEDRLVFRGSAEASYSSQVFYRLDYIKNMWGRFFDIVEVNRRLPGYQDVIVLRKTGNA